MSKNNVTGDRLVSKPSTDESRSGWDLIWGKKDVKNDYEYTTYSIAAEFKTEAELYEHITGCKSNFEKPHCNRCGKKLGDKDHIHTCTPKGYTEEELDADNPYNNWMNEK